jgi:UDP-N-acetylglucosamine kinase
MNNISEEAFKFAKKRKKEIIRQFIGSEVRTNGKPVFIFMAGAPGAGKTETSKWLVEILRKESLAGGIVRIDSDEVRKIFQPLGYNGKNSDDYKRGCAKGVEILIDSCLKNKYHAVIDGTLSSLGVAKKNIDAAIKVNAAIYIVYVYQDPLIAWGFTKIREKEEGRRIEKEMFINALFNSISNVNTIKEAYKDRVEVWLVEKHIPNKTKNIRFNIDKIDNYIEINYNPITLRKILYEKDKR